MPKTGEADPADRRSSFAHQKQNVERHLANKKIKPGDLFNGSEATRLKERKAAAVQQARGRFDYIVGRRGERTSVDYDLFSEPLVVWLYSKENDRVWRNRLYLGAEMMDIVSALNRDVYPENMDYEKVLDWIKNFKTNWNSK